MNIKGWKTGKPTVLELQRSVQCRLCVCVCVKSPTHTVAIEIIARKATPCYAAYVRSLPVLSRKNVQIYLLRPPETHTEDAQDHGASELDCSISAISH